MDWIKLPTGSYHWNYHDTERGRKLECIVYKKRGTKSSWRWLVKENGVVKRLTGGARAYSWPSATKAKADIQGVLLMMSQGLSWADATN